MRRLIAWLAGVAGGIAAYRWLTRHRAPAVSAPLATPGEAVSDPRAAELRAKLDEAEAPEPEDGANPETPEERRRRVHEEGRTALDEIHRSAG
ncbi:MAG TPA: hypothetical protein VH416_09425 [Gaiellaceae bacterium]